MPRRRPSQTLLSPEQSNSSEQFQNQTLNEEFPDTGLQQAGDKGGKKIKNVSFNLEAGEASVDLTGAPSTSQHEVIVISSSKSNANANQPAPTLHHSNQPQVAAVGANKIYKIGECVKSMNIEIHPALFSAWYMCDLPREAEACGVRVLPAHDIADPSAVLWTRNTSRKITTADGQIRLTPTKAQCDRCLYIMTMSSIVCILTARELTDYMTHRADLIGGHVTLVIYNANDYFKKSSKKYAPGMMQEITESDLDRAITDLMVSLKMETILVNSSNDLALLIMQYTKAIAEEPFKRAQRDIDEQAQFYMRGDNKNCVSVDKNGNGLSRLWQQMIAVLPMSSLEISRSLSAQYKSPKALANELSTPDGVTEVSNLGVNRAGAPTARARRLGPEFARKLQTLFTSEDGNVLIE